MAFLDLVHIEKAFGTTRVVKDFNLTVAKGEFVSFLGPSGCGKTTTLRMIAGFETPTSGSIRIDGREVTGLKPNQRNIGMVFQSYALFPNLTVDQNVEFGMRVAGVDRTTRRTRVKEMLGIVGLADFGARYPFQLSGGQQQRVALARALFRGPSILILDEPNSNLDADGDQELLQCLHQAKARGTTVLLVAHRMSMMPIVDGLLIIQEGRVAAYGPRDEILRKINAQKTVSAPTPQPGVA